MQPATRQKHPAPPTTPFKPSANAFPLLGALQKTVPAPMNTPIPAPPQVQKMPRPQHSEPHPSKLEKTVSHISTQTQIDSTNSASEQVTLQLLRERNQVPESATAALKTLATTANAQVIKIQKSLSYLSPLNELDFKSALNEIGTQLEEFKPISTDKANLLQKFKTHSVYLAAAITEINNCQPLLNAIIMNAFKKIMKHNILHEEIDGGEKATNEYQSKNEAAYNELTQLWYDFSLNEIAVLQYHTEYTHMYFVLNDLKYLQGEFSGQYEELLKLQNDIKTLTLPSLIDKSHKEMSASDTSSLLQSYTEKANVLKEQIRTMKAVQLKISDEVEKIAAVLKDPIELKSEEYRLSNLLKDSFPQDLEPDEAIAAEKPILPIPVNLLKGIERTLSRGEEDFNSRLDELKAAMQMKYAVMGQKLINCCNTLALNLDRAEGQAAFIYDTCHLIPQLNAFNRDLKHVETSLKKNPSGNIISIQSQLQRDLTEIDSVTTGADAIQKGYYIQKKEEKQKVSPTIEQIMRSFEETHKTSDSSSLKLISINQDDLVSSESQKTEFIQTLSDWTRDETEIIKKLYLEYATLLGSLQKISESPKLIQIWLKEQSKAQSQVKIELQPLSLESSSAASPHSWYSGLAGLPSLSGLRSLIAPATSTSGAAAGGTREKHSFSHASHG